MNIAVFTNNYKPFVGGVPISIERLCDSMRLDGHKVWVFAPEYPNYIEEEGIIRVPLLKYQETKNFDFPIANIFSRKLRKQFNELNIDVIHVHHPFWMGKLGVEFGEKYNIPVVFTYHTRYEKYVHNIPFNSLISDKIIHNKVRRFMERCDRVIAPSNCIEKHLRIVGGNNNIDVLPTGISKDIMSTDNKRVEEIRNQYCEKNEKLLCSISRLTEEKNLNTLIRNLGKLKEITTESIKCIILGEGPERENLENLISELNLENEVKLIGNIPQKEIGNYYKASDLFVFNSLSETQGLVLGEAMINGTPVVALDGTGVRDIVIDGRNGFLPKTSEEFVLDCKIVLEDKEILEKLSRGATITSKEITSESIAKKMANIYNLSIEGKVYNEKGFIFS